MIRIPHLETDVTTACQLSCVGCNHEVPLWRRAQGGPLMVSPDVVTRDLNHLAAFLHADVWGALGGEPLLHPRLDDVLERVRQSGIADRIEVWTNGIAFRRAVPGVLHRGLLDALVLSRYEGKVPDADVRWMAEWCESEGVELVVKDHRPGQPYGGNFRTLLEPSPTGEAETRAKFAGCFFRHFSRNVTAGWFFTCCCAPHMPAMVQGLPFGTDGVQVEGLTEAGLRAYLERKEPLGACYRCAGRDTAVPIAWREERDPERWLAASAGMPAGLARIGQDAQTEGER